MPLPFLAPCPNSGQEVLSGMAEFFTTRGMAPLTDDRQEQFIYVTCDRDRALEDIALEWDAKTGFCFRLTAEAATALAAQLSAALNQHPE